MEERLKSVGLPYISIRCYGHQIMIVAKGRETAEKWHALIAHFTSKPKLVETLLDNKVNKNTVLKPSKHKAYLIGGTISA